MSCFRLIQYVICVALINCFLQGSWAATNIPVSTTATPRENSKVNKTDLLSPQATFRQNLTSVGITFTESNNTLDVIVDEGKAIAALPMLASQGVIPKIDAKDMQKAPLSLAVGVVGVSFTIVILDAIYSSNNAVDKMKVQAYIIPMGNKPKQLCFSFDYDRKLYKNLDLNTLTPRDFILHTPNFNFSQWCKSGMDKESKP